MAYLTFGLLFVFALAFRLADVNPPENAGYTTSAGPIAFVDMETPTVRADGKLSLSYESTPAQSLQLFRNGGVLVGNTDFTTAGNLVTLRVPALAGDRFVAWYRHLAPPGVGFHVGGSGALDCATVPGQCDISSVVVPFKMSDNSMEGVNTFSQLRLKLYAVAKLPKCVPALEGQLESVSDALAGPFETAVVAGGKVHTRVYCNGSAWVH